MRFLKFIFKVLLTVTIVVVVFGWFFYEYYKPLEQAEEQPLVVNDITGLNPVNVAQYVRPTTEQEIIDAILATTGPISIGGERYSMGGQIAYPDSLHLDMRDYDDIIELDAENKLITVQAGITWKEVQTAIDPHNLSIKVMQDFNNFSVGGSLSVNAHGRFMGTGPIIHTVKSIRMVLSDGNAYEATPHHHYALFNGAIGGYGGLGVITEVTLELTDNRPIERSSEVMGFNAYLQHFYDRIQHDQSVVLHNAFLYPPSYEVLRVNSWRTTEKPLTNERRLRQFNHEHWWKPAVIDLMARFDLLKRLRQNLIDPIIHERPTVVMRNWESSYDLHEFGFSSAANSTLALREYFVPMRNFEVFVLKLRDVYLRYKVNVLNISIRYAPKDEKSLLAWAKDDVFSFVVSYQQGRDEESIKQVDRWSNELNQAAIESGGSYYMPFQIQDAPDQFYQAYPKADQFFDLKRWTDPNNRFNNMLWLAFYPDNQPAKAAWLKSLERQTAEGES